MCSIFLFWFNWIRRLEMGWRALLTVICFYLPLSILENRRKMKHPFESKPGWAWDEREKNETRAISNYRTTQIVKIANDRVRKRLKIPKNRIAIWLKRIADFNFSFSKSISYSFGHYLHRAKYDCYNYIRHIQILKKKSELALNWTWFVCDIIAPTDISHICKPKYV